MLQIFLVEELGHVVLPACNLQLGEVGPVVADVSERFAHLRGAATDWLQASTQVVQDTYVVLEEMSRQVEASAGQAALGVSL